MTNERKVIVRAKINDEVMVIDLAARADKYDENAYQDVPRAKKYLGKGKYHSYDGVPANDETEMHFWIWTA